MQQFTKIPYVALICTQLCGWNGGMSRQGVVSWSRKGGQGQAHNLGAVTVQGRGLGQSQNPLSALPTKSAPIAGLCYHGSARGTVSALGLALAPCCHCLKIPSCDHGLAHPSFPEHSSPPTCSPIPSAWPHTLPVWVPPLLVGVGWTH